MKKHVTIPTGLFFVSILSFGLYSCTNKKHQPKVLFDNSTEHYFSSLKTKDLFKLTLTGDSILTGKFVFEIVNHSKKRIFSDTFSGFYFLGDMDDTTITLKQKEDTIRKRTLDFFAENNFHHPATSNADTAFLDPDVESINTYEDIESDTSAIGFYYFYGYEGNYNIAYSKKKKKVVIYLSYD